MTFKLRFHFASLRNGKGQETQKLPPRAETSVLKPFWLCNTKRERERGGEEVGEREIERNVLEEYIIGHKIYRKTVELSLKE